MGTRRHSFLHPQPCLGHAVVRMQCNVRLPSTNGRLSSSTCGQCPDIHAINVHSDYAGCRQQPQPVVPSDGRPSNASLHHGTNVRHTNTYCLWYIILAVTPRVERTAARSFDTARSRDRHPSLSQGQGQGPSHSPGKPPSPSRLADSGSRCLLEPQPATAAVSWLAIIAIHKATTAPPAGVRDRLSLTQ